MKISKNRIILILGVISLLSVFGYVFILFTIKIKGNNYFTPRNEISYEEFSTLGFTTWNLKCIHGREMLSAVYDFFIDDTIFQVSKNFLFTEDSIICTEDKLKFFVELNNPNEIFCLVFNSDENNRIPYSYTLIEGKWIREETNLLNEKERNRIRNRVLDEIIYKINLCP